MTDLYEILAVPRDATEQQIRKAYRAKSKTAHPDVGGDREAWDLIQLAEDVLTDPERRARYDETGSYEPGRADNAQSQIWEYLCGATLHTIGMLAGKKDLAHTDLVVEVRAAIREKVAGLLQSIRQSEKQAAELSEIAGRFSVAEGENRVQRMLLAQRDDILKGAGGPKKECELAEKALAELARYSYRRDQPAAAQPGFIYMTQDQILAQAQQIPQPWMGR